MAGADAYIILKGGGAVREYQKDRSREGRVRQKSEKPMSKRERRRLVRLSVSGILLVLVVAGVAIPQGAVDFISPIAAANPFVAMLMVGMMFEVDLKPGYLRQMGLVLGLRLGSAVLLAVAMYQLLPFSLPIRQVLAVMVFAPASVIAPAFTVKCGGDAGLAGCLNSLTILAGILGMLCTILVLGVA